MKKRKAHILYLGENGFPYGFGAVQRQLLIAKGLVAQNCKVTIISYQGKHEKNKNFPPEGIFDGIHYRYTSGSIYRPAGLIKRKRQNVVGKLKELAFIWQLKKKENIDVCLLSTMDIDMLLLYWIWLKLLKIPFGLNYVELNTAISFRSGKRERINDYLFDRLAPSLADGLLPISEFLMEHVKKMAPQKPLLKVPIVCDFERFDRALSKEKGIRFLYCGSPSYLQLITFVLRAFDYLDIEGTKVFLNMILGGKEKYLKRVYEEVAKMRNRRHIQIFPNLEDEDIPKHYAKASALLIPLRPTIQDAARFPHKIGEYLASGKPVITTLFGEIRHYDFIDQKTALIAEDYDPKSFSEKMKFVLQHPKKAKIIGTEGREMGLKNFNYKDAGARIKDFLFSLTTPKIS